MYGGIGCRDPGVYARLRSEFEKLWGSCESRDGFGWVVGGHAFRARRMVCEVGRSVCVVDGEHSLYTLLNSPSPKPVALDYQIEGNLLRIGPRHRGNLAVLDPHARTLHLAVDWSGTFPLYVAPHDGGLVFSSHLRPLARAIGARVDKLAVLEFLQKGYTYAGRTIFEGVRRLLPGQAVYYHAGMHDPVIHETSRAWADQDPDAPLPADEHVWGLLVEAVEACVAESGSLGLMMSAGWDSRTLLAACPPALREELVCYSHGDVQSRELGLAARLCASAGVRCHLEPIDDRVLDLDRIQRGFARVENVVFPHWHRAGELLANAGVSVVMSGVYGEILGGHYGPAMLMSRSGKIASVAGTLIGASRISRADAGTSRDVAAFLRLQGLSAPWYLHADFYESIPSPLDGINAEIDGAIERLRRRGVLSPHQLIEAFISEHRGTQYINAQLLSCRGHVDVALPFADRALLSLASRLPLHAKLHNQVNCQVLRKYAPELLRPPTAATFVPAASPVIVQEASRLVRRAYEELRWRLYHRSRRRLPPPRLGWVFFEFLRSGTRLRNLIEDLRGDMWDREALHRRLDSIVKGEGMEDLHPIYDQLGKIYTVDLMLR